MCTITEAICYRCIACNICSVKVKKYVVQTRISAPNNYFANQYNTDEDLLTIRHQNNLPQLKQFDNDLPQLNNDSHSYFIMIIFWKY